MRTISSKPILKFHKVYIKGLNTYLFIVSAVILKAHPKRLIEAVLCIIRHPAKKIVAVDNPKVLWHRVIQMRFNAPPQLEIPSLVSQMCTHPTTADSPPSPHATPALYWEQ